MNGSLDICHEADLPPPPDRFGGEDGRRVAEAQWVSIKPTNEPGSFFTPVLSNEASITQLDRKPVAVVSVWADFSVTDCDTFGFPSRQPDIWPKVCDQEDERTLGRNWLPVLQNCCLFWAQEHKNLPRSIAVCPFATLKLNIDGTRNLIVAGERRDGNKIDVALRAPIKKEMGWQWTGNNWQIVLSVRLPVSPCYAQRFSASQKGYAETLHPSVQEKMAENSQETVNEWKRSMLASRDACEHSRECVSVFRASRDDEWGDSAAASLQFLHFFKTSPQQASHALRHISFSHIYSFYDIWI